MHARIPELRKKPGVCYAVTDAGVELPVIDVTHPAFTEHVDAATVEAAIAGSIAAMQRAMALPPEAFRAMRDSSILMRGMVQSADTYLSGMMTYYYKLGPENLGDGYAGSADRAVAAAITPLSMRERFRHMVRMLADALVPALAARRGPLHLVNIAGGPCIDSHNTLIVLARERPELLQGPPGGAPRPVVVHALDLDHEGPNFGSRALAALLADGAPLQGLDVTFRHLEYDWADPGPLASLLREIAAAPDAIVAGASEGGLFEYPTDDQMVDTLGVFRANAPQDAIFIGTIVRDTTTLDPRMAPMEAMKGRPTIRFIGLQRFRALAARGGWRVAATADEAIHHVVLLEPAPAR